MTPTVSRFDMPSEPPSVIRGGDGSGLSDSDDDNEGRFSREFSEVQRIGEGHFSVVFQARHNLDRCTYAVKRMKQISKHRRQQKQSLQEAFVMASMALEAEGCPDIVRYFSSWFEGSQMFIQMELCQGSLRDHLALLCEMRQEDPRCRESEIVDVMRDVGRGLRSMHSCGFAHLDIKPDNVMRAKGSSGRWKIGDLGLAAAALGSGCDEICEGDCRYLAREVMQGDLTNLEKGDVFSLGIMTYEMVTNPRPLPCDGEEWQALRDGKLDTSLLADLSPDLCDMLCSLVRRIASERPSCEEILECCSGSHSAGTSPVSPCSPLQPRTAPRADESAEVRRLQKEVEELGRSAQESQLMADKYRNELILLRSKFASVSAPTKRRAATWGHDGDDELPMGPRYSI